MPGRALRIVRSAIRTHLAGGAGARSARALHGASSAKGPRGARTWSGRGPRADGCQARRAPGRPAAPAPWPISNQSGGRGQGPAQCRRVLGGMAKACCQPAFTGVSDRRRCWPASAGRSPRRPEPPVGRPPVERRPAAASTASRCPRSAITRVTGGCSCQTVVSSLPLAVPRPGVLSIRAILLGRRPGDPHVPDAEVAQLRSDVGVGRAGDQPAGPGRRPAPGPQPSRRRRTRGPRRRAGADRRRAPSSGPRRRSDRWRVSRAPRTRRRTARVLQVRRAGRPAAVRSIGPLAPAQTHQPAAPSTVTTATARPTSTVGLQPAEAALPHLGRPARRRRRRRRAAARRTRSAGSARSRAGSRCRSAARRRPAGTAPPPAATRSARRPRRTTTTAAPGRRASPTTAATQMTPKSMAPTHSGGRPGPTSRPSSRPHTGGAVRGAAERGVRAGEQAPGLGDQSSAHQGGRTSSGQPEGDGRSGRPSAAYAAARPRRPAPTSVAEDDQRGLEGGQPDQHDPGSPAAAPGLGGARPAQHQSPEGEHQHRQQRSRRR